MKLFVISALVAILAVSINFCDSSFLYADNATSVFSRPEKVRWVVEGKHYKVSCFSDNSSAEDCTYEDLLSFLKEDKTD